MCFIRNFFRILMNGVHYRFLCQTISSLNVIYIVIYLSINLNNVIYLIIFQILESYLMLSKLFSIINRVNEAITINEMVVGGRPFDSGKYKALLKDLPALPDEAP